MASRTKFQVPWSSLSPLFCRREKASQQLFRGLPGQRESQVGQGCRIRSGSRALQRGGAWEAAHSPSPLPASLATGTAESELCKESNLASGQGTNYFRFISIKPFTFTISPKCLPTLPTDSVPALKDEDNLEVKAYMFISAVLLSHAFRGHEALK